MVIGTVVLLNRCWIIKFNHLKCASNLLKIYRLSHDELTYYLCLSTYLLTYLPVSSLLFLNNTVGLMMMVVLMIMIFMLQVRKAAMTRTLLRRFSRFTTESLWNSQYAKFFRDLLLNPAAVHSYGDLAALVISAHSRTHVSRDVAVAHIRDQAMHCFHIDASRRSLEQQMFVYGLMNQPNELKGRICLTWSHYQYADLCNSTQLVTVPPLSKVCTVC